MMDLLDLHQPTMLRKNVEMKQQKQNITIPLSLIFVQHLMGDERVVEAVGELVHAYQFASYNHFSYLIYV